MSPCFFTPGCLVQRTNVGKQTRDTSETYIEQSSTSRRSYTGKGMSRLAVCGLQRVHSCYKHQHCSDTIIYILDHVQYTLGLMKG